MIKLYKARTRVRKLLTTRAWDRHGTGHVWSCCVYPVGLAPVVLGVCLPGTSAIGSYRTSGGTFSRLGSLGEIHRVVKDGCDAPSRGEAAFLDDPGAPRAVGARDVRLPASSVEPVDGLTCAVRVARLGDHGLNPGQQRGSTLQPEGTSLPVRVPGAHLHPRLRRPPSGAGPSSRAGSQA